MKTVMLRLYFLQILTKTPYNRIYSSYGHKSWHVRQRRKASDNRKLWWQRYNLKQRKNIVLSPTEFPELKNYIGKTLITTDGTTLLGADDKAGIAEIITAMEYLINHPEIKHGNIKVAFTPDEEIGRCRQIWCKKFNCDFAYTVDGGGIGEIEYENFNAASAKIKINGRNVHPGTAKGKMKTPFWLE